MPCPTAHRTGSKSCQPWPSECNPRSSQWCARNNDCEANCNMGKYYDSKEKKCLRCPYGTYQYRQGTGCCQVRTCPSGKIPGPSRYNGVFPPLCVKKPEAPSLTLECCSDGTCNKTQGRCGVHPCVHQWKLPSSAHYCQSALPRLPSLSAALFPAQLFECHSPSRVACSTLLLVTLCMGKMTTALVTRCITSFRALRGPWSLYRSSSWQQGTHWSSTGLPSQAPPQ